jgi:hypothetical protein
MPDAAVGASAVACAIWLELQLMLANHALPSALSMPEPCPALPPLQVFSEAVQDLQTDYLDLMLLHYPECWGDLCGGVKPEGTWQDRWACTACAWCVHVVRCLPG